MKKIVKECLYNYIDRLEPHCLPELAAVLFAGLMLGFWPLSFWGSYSGITAAKFYIFLWIVIDFSLALLLSLAWTKRFKRNLWHTVQHSWSLPQRLLLLFGGLAMLSALLSPYPSLVLTGGRRLSGLITLLLLIYTALALAALADFKNWFFELMAVSSLLMSLVCLLQLAGGNPCGLYPNGLSYADGGVRYASRFLGPIGNVDMASAYWCLALPLLLGGVLLRRGWSRLLLAVALLTGLAVEFLLDVDSGRVAILGSLLLLGPFLLPQGKRKWGWLAGCLLLASGLLFIYGYQGPEEGTLWELSRVLHGDIQDKFGSSRILIWKEAWNSMDGWQQWLLGSGPGTRSQHFTTVFSRVTESGQTLTAAVDSSHSEYLDDLLELGLLGLLTYLAALAVTAGKTFKALLSATADPRLKFLAWSWCCYLLQAIFNFRSVAVTPLFWTVWGLLLALLQGNQPPLLCKNYLPNSKTTTGGRP